MHLPPGTLTASYPTPNQSAVFFYLDPSPPPFHRSSNGNAIGIPLSGGSEGKEAYQDVMREGPPVHPVLPHTAPPLVGRMSLLGWTDREGSPEIRNIREAACRQVADPPKHR